MDSTFTRLEQQHQKPNKMNVREKSAQETKMRPKEKSRPKSTEDSTNSMKSTSNLGAAHHKPKVKWTAHIPSKN
jgi:hypothetical protein